MWDQAGYVRGLAPRPLILIDHRGHGASDRPAAPAEHSIDRYVADVVAVLDAVGARQAAFIGYSDGVRVGLALAAANRERVAALIGLGALGGEEASETERRADADEIRLAGMPSIVDALEADEPGRVPDWFKQQMLDTDAEMLALELDGWADWAGPWATAEKIQAPALLIVGEYEESEPGLASLHAAALAARIRDGRAVEQQGVGHVGLFVRSDLNLPVIRALLETLEAG
jgi:pimeloyl-ACP methyl ester carboxylesterase